MSGPSKKIYQFRVTLKGIRPPIWRRIQVPGNYSFWDLHVAIQDAMGWFDYHLHSFEMINPKTGFREEIGIPDDDFGAFDHDVMPGWERRISRYFTPENSKSLYTYDFGDNWEHEIRLEKILPPEKGIPYPRCIKGKRACPPEDCGGVWGYGDMLETLSDPEHEDYKDTVEWLGEVFDPEYFDLAEIEFDDPEERWKMAFTQDREPDEADPDEVWEGADDYLDDEEEPEFNPFLHIAIHSVVENQLAERDPIEVFQFYNAMRKKKCPHHDTIHLIGMILTPLMFGVLQGEETFDPDIYKALLKKYKTRNPEKIPDLLEKDPDLFPHNA